MDTNLGSIPMTKPYAYHEINSIRHQVDISYTINGNTYGFKVGNYDDRYLLVIDPLLASTFLGGNYIDYPGGMAVDPSGNVYVVGQTASTNFPGTSGAYQTTNLSLDYLKASDSTVTRYISVVDKHYNPKILNNLPLQFVTSKDAAVKIEQVIPFPYHDSTTEPDYDLYSTIIEVGGKYYSVVLEVPK